MLNDNLFVRNLNIIFMLKKLFLKIYFTIEKDNNINCSQEGICRKNECDSPCMNRGGESRS